jgi:glycosyltransferase involved in cell wall biosynthesis
MSASFMAHMLPRDGYGYAAIKIAEALNRLEAGFQIVDMSVDGGFPGPDVSWSVEGTAVVMAVPEWWRDIHAGRLVGYTMFETTRMPEGRVETINRHASACLVPCAWCADSFKEQGVSVPIHVVPWGIDPADYFPLDRSNHSGPYTFLWSGTGDFRKGWDVAYRAFRKAFGNRDDVRLRLHFREMPLGVRGFVDANVDVVVGLYDRPDLRQMLQAADCYVFPSRGEGWGLPPREAAATGLPVIATNWGGLAEEIDHWALPLGVRELRWASFHVWQVGEVGEWAEPDLDQLIALMRWCAENPELAANAGQQAAEWLKENTPWERTALGVMNVLKEEAYASPV